MKHTREWLWSRMIGIYGWYKKSVLLLFFIFTFVPSIVLGAGFFDVSEYGDNGQGGRLGIRVSLFDTMRMCYIFVHYFPYEQFNGEGSRYLYEPLPDTISSSHRPCPFRIDRQGNLYLDEKIAASLPDNIIISGSGNFFITRQNRNRQTIDRARSIFGPFCRFFRSAQSSSHSSRRISVTTVMETIDSMSRALSLQYRTNRLMWVRQMWLYDSNTNTWRIQANPLIDNYEQEIRWLETNAIRAMIRVLNGYATIPLVEEHILRTATYRLYEGGRLFMVWCAPSATTYTACEIYNILVRYFTEYDYVVVLPVLQAPDSPEENRPLIHEILHYITDGANFRGIRNFLPNEGVLVFNLDGIHWAGLRILYGENREPNAIYYYEHGGIGRMPEVLRHALSRLTARLRVENNTPETNFRDVVNVDNDVWVIERLRAAIQRDLFNQDLYAVRQAQRGMLGRNNSNVAALQAEETGESFDSPASLAETAAPEGEGASVVGSLSPISLAETVAPFPDGQQLVLRRPSSLRNRRDSREAPCVIETDSGEQSLSGEGFISSPDTRSATASPPSPLFLYDRQENATPLNLNGILGMPEAEAADAAEAPPSSIVATFMMLRHL